jgi:hypothetical protein
MKKRLNIYMLSIMFAVCVVGNVFSMKQKRKSFDLISNLENLILNSNNNLTDLALTDVVCIFSSPVGPDWMSGGIGIGKFSGDVRFALGEEGKKASLGKLYPFRYGINSLKSNELWARVDTLIKHINNNTNKKEGVGKIKSALTEIWQYKSRIEKNYKVGPSELLEFLDKFIELEEWLENKQKVVFAGNIGGFFALNNFLSNNEKLPENIKELIKDVESGCEFSQNEMFMNVSHKKSSEKNDVSSIMVFAQKFKEEDFYKKFEQVIIGSDLYRESYKSQNNTYEFDLFARGCANIAHRKQLYSSLNNIIKLEKVLKQSLEL